MRISFLLIMVAIIVAGFVLVHILNRRQFTKRSGALRDAGFEFGLNKAHAGDVLAQIPSKELPMFNLFRESAIETAMSGSIGDVELFVFDFSFYSLSRGNNIWRIRHTVAAFKINGPTLPLFALWPAEVPGAATDLEAQDAPMKPQHMQPAQNVANSYVLHAPDPDAARELFTPKLIDHLQNAEPWAVEGVGSWLIIYRPLYAWPTQQLAQHVEKTFELFSAFEI